MRSLRQIKVINQALDKERERYLRELGMIVKTIEKKQSLIQRMADYRREYFADGNLMLTKAVPTLNKNLDLFDKKMEAIIQQTESEVLQFQKSKEAVMQKITTIDSKIQLMELFKIRIHQKTLVRADKQEQRMLDDLSTIKNVRDDNE